MGRRKTSRTTAHPDQLSLFAQEIGSELVKVPEPPRTEPGAMDCRHHLRKWLTDQIKASGFSRDAIAQMLSGYTGVEVTKHTIDMWTKDSHPSDMPAHFLAALTVILGVGVLDHIAQNSGCRVASTEQLTLARLGQMIVLQDAVHSEQRRLIADLPLMKAGGRHE